MLFVFNCQTLTGPALVQVSYHVDIPPHQNSVLKLGIPLFCKLHKQKQLHDIAQFIAYLITQLTTQLTTQLITQLIT